MVNVLGINLSELKNAEVVQEIKKIINGHESKYITTPNPEIILNAHRDEELFYILNKAALSLVDGFGLQLAARLMGEKIPRLTGADLTKILLKDAEETGIKVIILNWENGLSSESEISAALSNLYPNLNFSILDIADRQKLNDYQKEKINSKKAQILFCTFGSPYQEKIIYHHLKDWPTVKLAVGVGGAFDFITKKAIRAPKFLRRIGLEWIWRLIIKPRRIRRIYNATLVFIIKVLRARFINPFLYRPNVACLLYKKEDGKNKILLVEREDEPGHWQLPQGGLDGEDIETAGKRELKEETGADKIDTKKIFKNLYRYEFQLNSDCFKKYDYKGQKQSLYIGEYLGKDEELKINFWDHTSWKWVAADKLVQEVHPVRRAAAKIFLDKFKSLNV